jgi:pimeloyl-ACP methyl ester carboxylesterase
VNPVPALEGERFEFEGRPPPDRAAAGASGGPLLSCYVAGQGPPLLLVHSVNAAASAAEVRPLYDHYRSRRRVYAIDLPGFGLSERGPLDYTPRLMTDALHAVAAQIRARCGTQPIDAMALSLGCEFLARAAVEAPAQWGRLALVSPTGFMGRRARRAAPGSTRAMPWLHRLLSAPWWSQALFDGLTRPGVVRYFLERTWGSRQIDETMWADAVRAAAQPGARHAPLVFLSGGLFSADIHTVYEALAQEIWMSHGVRGDFTDYRGCAIVRGRANWRFSVFDSGALPYFERAGEFIAAFDAFLDASARAPSSRS